METIEEQKESETKNAHPRGKYLQETPPARPTNNLIEIRP